MNEPCKFKPGSLNCEECDDWVLISEAVRIEGVVKVRLREKCRRAYESSKDLE